LTWPLVFGFFCLLIKSVRAPLLSQNKQSKVGLGSTQFEKVHLTIFLIP
jgi:hypothetical protein